MASKKKLRKRIKKLEKCIFKLDTEINSAIVHFDALNSQHHEAWKMYSELHQIDQDTIWRLANLLNEYLAEDDKIIIDPVKLELLHALKYQRN